jgi:hypothetical protein
MVLDDTNVTHVKVFLKTTGGVCHNEHLDAHQTHHAHGQHNGGHIVSLVEVEATFHAHNLNTIHGTKDELAVVSLDSHLGETRNILQKTTFVLGGMLATMTTIQCEQKIAISQELTEYSNTTGFSMLSESMDKPDPQMIPT